MTALILDTSGLLAAMDAGQRMHEACADSLRAWRGELVLSPFVLAELDYLVGKNMGVEAQDALLEEVAAGAYQLSPFDAAEVTRARAIIHKYRSLRIGLADASLVVLAEKWRTRTVLTLDRRHLGTMRTADRKTFRLLPDVI